MASFFIRIYVLKIEQPSLPTKEICCFVRFSLLWCEAFRLHTGFFRNIIETFRNTNKKFIALIGTPVPAVTGIDIDDIANKLENTLNIPVFAFNTTGFENYARGVSDAYLALAKHYITSHGKKVQRSVNILGATPLDIGSDHHLNMLTSLLERAGLNVIASWTMGCRFEDLCNSSYAEMNIVISHTALPLAQYMEEMYEIPYILSIPIGIHHSINLFALIDEKIQGNLKLDLETPSEKNGPKLPEGTRALIIGEPVMSYCIKQCLITDFGVDEVRVASLFPLNNLPQIDHDTKDLYIEQEEDLGNLIEREHFDIIVGDPYYRSFIDKKKQLYFIPLPHLALSGQDYCRSDYAYIGEQGYHYFCKSLFG